MPRANYSINHNAVLSNASVAVAMGQAVLKTTGGYVLATSSNRTLYGRRTDGIALDNASPGRAFRIAHNGLLDAEESNLDAGDESWVRVDDDGNLERVDDDDIEEGDDLVGRCATDGDLHLSCNTWTAQTATASGGGGGTVANDIAKQGGTDINRVQGFNRVPFKTRAGAATSDGDAPPVGGTWVYSERRGVEGLRPDKPVPPGHINVENYGGHPYDGRTGSISSGSTSLTMSSVEDYEIGDKLFIRGVTGVKTITNIVGSVVTINSAADATVTDALVFFDNFAAFTEAIAECESYAYNDAKKFTKIIANGAYFISETLEFTRACIFQGSGSQTPFSLSLLGLSDTSSTFPGTYLIFPFGTTGLHIYSQLGGVGDADRMCVKDMTITTFGYVDDSEGHVIPDEGYGIEAHCRIWLENVHVEGFGSHGIYYLANNSDPEPVAGNGSGGGAINTKSSHNGGSGFYIEGGDANVIGFMCCDANSNTGYGFDDQSGLGCSFFSCHAEGNGGWNPDTHPYELDTYSYDGYNHDYRNRNNPLCRSVFIGCYSEQSKNALYDPAEVIGGYVAGSDLEEGCTAIVKDGARMYGSGLHHINYEGAVDVEAHLGVAGSAMTAAKWVTSTGAQLTFNWNNTNKTWCYRIQDSGYFENLRFPSSLSHWTHQAPWLPCGLYLGDDSALNIKTLLLASPTVPTNTGLGAPNRASYEIGDIVFYGSATVAGGKIGQVCVTAGTKGTFMADVTADTTEDSATVVLSDYEAVYIGAYINVVGVTGPLKVTDQSGATLTVDPPADATVNDGAVSFSAPVFKDFGDIDA